MNETDRLGVALDLARRAGRLTLDHFRTPTLRAESKKDGSPVTVADRAAEELIRDELARIFPDDAVRGEEFGITPGTSGYTWIIDPVDGTVSFVAGVPLFGTLIGVERHGEPIAGVMEFPALDERAYAGAGTGAWHVRGNGAPERARVSNTRTMREGTLLITAPDLFIDRPFFADYERLIRASRLTRGWSDCYAAMLVVTGRAEAAVEPIVNAWDVAAMRPIIREAGGRFSDFEGQDSIETGTMVLTNGHVHEEVLGLIRA